MYRINIDRKDRTRLHVVDTEDGRCLPPKDWQDKRHGFWTDVETIGAALEIADRNGVRLMPCGICRWKRQELHEWAETLPGAGFRR